MHEEGLADEGDAAGGDVVVSLLQPVRPKAWDLLTKTTAAGGADVVSLLQPVRPKAWDLLTKATPQAEPK
jgi:hypothetical protein